MSDTSPTTPSTAEMKATRAISRVTSALGSFQAMGLSVLLIATWLAAGPFFHFSDTWQLVINTTTTIITFIMVFVIQSTQNRDNLALQTKLDDVLRALKDTNNELVGLEDLPESDLRDTQAKVREEAGDSA